ncbi:MAG: excinuclease ABC subunit UvrC [Pseudomonadota bacterium]
MSEKPSEPSGFDASRFVKHLSHRPGVYRMYDADGEIIYVGKARDLKKRVSTYFSGKAKDTKTMAMVSRVANVEVTLTNTEVEALLLEHTLIKQHRPRFNIVLRDDKSYPWIRASTSHEYPRLSFYRGKKRKKDQFFGPYPSAAAVKNTLNELQKLFQVRQCRDSFFANRSRPCLQYQIKRCSGPCVGLISPEDYAQDVADSTAFLKGRNRDVIDRLVVRMEDAAASLDFEQAARLRDQVARLRRIEAEQRVSTQANVDADVFGLFRSGRTTCVAVLFVRAGRVLGSRTFLPKNAEGNTDDAVLDAFLGQFYLDREAPAELIVPVALQDGDWLTEALTSQSGHKVMLKHQVRADRAAWLAMAYDNAQQGAGLEAASRASIDLQYQSLADLFDLDEPPARVECFDISHTGGEATVASCVVFGSEGPLKSDYRRFNIQTTDTGDDYAAMREALQRRYERVKKGEVAMPDMVLIDGGKGQLRQAADVMSEYGLDDIMLVGVAKGRARKAGAEQLFLVDQSRPIIPGPDSPALLLIQRVRDEAHRFAITGHRGRREKARKVSGLEAIPGLGPVRRRQLLTQFGGLQGVRRASIDDLAKLKGISRQMAERIYLEFHQSIVATKDDVASMSGSNE